MSPESVTIVVGLGEVGKPLFDILSRTHTAIGVDIQPVEVFQPCRVLHLCIPFQMPDFLGVSAAYIAKYRPEYTVINSTVAPGTTMELAGRTGALVAYSPVRGKHARMEADMLHYKKFVGADDEQTAAAITKHFNDAGFRTGLFRSSQTGELAKLLETTWLGVLVGWAQEVERIAALYSATYSDMDGFIEEIAFLPHVFPGYIGGHCVMPNISILRSVLQSDYLDAIVKSNQLKAERMTAAGTPPPINARAVAAIAHTAAGEIK